MNWIIFAHILYTTHTFAREAPGTLPPSHVTWRWHTSRIWFRYWCCFTTVSQFILFSSFRLRMLYMVPSFSCTPYHMPSCDQFSRPGPFLFASNPLPRQTIVIAHSIILIFLLLALLVGINLQLFKRHSDRLKFTGEVKGQRGRLCSRCDRDTTSFTVGWLVGLVLGRFSSIVGACWVNKYCVLLFAILIVVLSFHSSILIPSSQSYGFRFLFKFLRDSRFSINPNTRVTRLTGSLKTR